MTKPIQYINATNIDDSNDKDCYITNTFSDANLFVSIIRDQSRHWSCIFFIKSKHQALINVLQHKSKYSNLYLDSDVGIILRLFLVFLYPIKIYVYEEGLASYIPEVREKVRFKNIFKYIIDFFLGENWSGGSFRTQGIYVYHPSSFKILVNRSIKKQILKFKKPLIDHINSLPDIRSFYSHEEFDYIRGKDILLYLTSWTLNPQYEEVYNMYPNFIKIIKFHPHINKESIPKELFQFDYYPDRTIPAEILISTFIELAEKIVIIHEGTAAMLNFVSEDKIIEYNIANAKYNEIYMKIKTEFVKEISSYLGSTEK